MPQDVLLADEPRAWLLRSLEDKAIRLLLEQYENDPQLIEAIRERGANATPSMPTRPGISNDFSIPMDDGVFWTVRPQDATEERCIDYLVKVWQIRNAVKDGDVFGAISLGWLFGYNDAAFVAEALYGKARRMEREERDARLAIQIRQWVSKEPHIKNSELARRLRHDPQHAPLVANIQALPKFISRLREKTDISAA